ncbi:polyprenal reductase isoform X2 [Procambarus clarkii]|uniref:polyprenal reductase isoform X2 n=1 Tax=Procambarus clarkii TaxID=6728 RepID=UPI001E675D35|nr:polyprenol reductase-like isoform X1 [Procambarus clarkii]XP_045584967.1 polyprenol reductase-like isoform X1 [Procambarus clarkii]
MEVFDSIMNLLIEWNLCILMFILYCVIISLGGVLVNFVRVSIPLPNIFLQAFKFGKMAHTGHINALVTHLEVPKRWFAHFYISASVIVTVALVQLWNLYVLRVPLPPWVSVTLDVLTTPHRRPTVNATTAALGIILLAIQIYRRLYENLFISVFSSGRINILHYIVGHTHYVGAVVLLLSQAPGFDGAEQHISFTGIEFWQIVGTIICFFGFAIQNKSLRMLAALRRNHGKKMKEKYMMPQGGLFEVVSCPHMFAEVVVYVGILVILRTHIGWSVVTIWVISNQIQVAIMNHKWYQETFKDYPCNRRAIIPFLL